MRQLPRRRIHDPSLRPPISLCSVEVVRSLAQILRYVMCAMSLATQSCQPHDRTTSESRHLLAQPAMFDERQTSENVKVWPASARRFDYCEVVKLPDGTLAFQPFDNQLPCMDEITGSGRW